MKESSPKYDFFFHPLASAFLLAGGVILGAGHAYAEPPPKFAFNIGSNQIPGGIWPVALAVDSQRKIYISSLFNLIEVDTNGAFLQRWGSQGTGPGQFSYSGQITFDRSDHLFVLDDYNNRVEDFTTSGNFITAWGSSGSNTGQFDQPTGLAVSSAGRVYVADSLNFRIQVFDSFGLFLKEFGSIGTNAGQFSFPGRIAMDSSNNLYVVDTPWDNFRIQKFDQDGNFLAQWVAYGTNAAGTIQVGGIATDPSNNVYVADGANNRVQKYSSDGVFLAEWGSFGSGPGEFNSPSGIAIDSTGNYVYVADYYNARINVFAYSGFAPLIYQPPTNQTLPAGETLTLAAGIFGATPLAYHWNFNGSDLPGASGPTLTLTNVSLAYTGVYSVTASNSFGISGSPSAAVSVVPVVVTTLPASGITATSAVLYGSFWVGSELTRAWFEWGTSTTYGNTVGFTNLNLFTSPAMPYPVTGLSGETVYHYRVAASNVLGVVYGQDVAFQVGLKPAVQTLAITRSADGSVQLGALVNPEARDTTAYFRWGRYSPDQFTTPTNQLPPVANPIAVQSQISGLIPGVIYFAQPVASNELGAVSGATVEFIAPPWVLLPIPGTHYWNNLAVSADGSNLVALPQTGGIYVSHDSGLNWISNTAPSVPWQAATVSADGTRIVAVAGGLSVTGPAYVSLNSGKSWVRSNGASRNWYAVASSGDGSRVAAVDPAKQSVLTSTNGGMDWQTNRMPVAAAWDTIASSGDGLRLITAAGRLSQTTNGPVLTSIDAGRTWISNSLPLAPWNSVASSADGRVLLAAIGGQQPGPVYVSTNYGLNWAESSAPVTIWQATAVSADGSELVALARRSATAVFVSTNQGVSWQAQVLPEATWTGIAISADGAKLFAAGDQIIVSLQTASQSILRPVRSGANLALSWVIPSDPFLLQESSDLSGQNWTNFSGTITTAFTNLTYQGNQPVSARSMFYRLKTTP